MVKHIEIGGASRPVRYNNNALEEFEQLTGLSVMDGLQLKKIGHLKALAFCGLKHGWLEEKDYKEPYPETLESIGRWFDMGNTAEIFKAFQEDTSSGNESGEVEAGKKSAGVTSGQ